MRSLPLPDRHQAVSDQIPCPLSRYDGTLHLGSRQLQVDIYAHHEEDYGYLADLEFDGQPMGRIRRAATATIALLGAFQQAANRGCLELWTPIDPGRTVFTLEVDRDFRGLTLKRTNDTYVVLGALSHRSQGLTRWLPFCNGFRCETWENNSFEALLRCVEFLDQNGMIV